MDILTIVGIALIVWGLLTAAMAVFKPKSLWKMGKIQGFVQLLGDKGTMIFLLVVGLIAIIAGGIILL